MNSRVSGLFYWRGRRGSNPQSFESESKMLSIAPRPHKNQYSIARFGSKRKKNIGETVGVLLLKSLRCRGEKCGGRGLLRSGKGGGGLGAHRILPVVCKRINISPVDRDGILGYSIWMRKRITLEGTA